MNKITTLAQICDALSDGLHKAPIFNPNGEYLFVNATNLENGHIVDKGEGKRADFSEFQKYGIELNDRTILYSIDGTIGNIAKYRGEKVILGKGACYLMVNESVDPDFIYFLLQSEAFNGYIRKMSTGSTIHHISLETMRNFKFSLPDYEDQKRISSVLMALENKIHHNTRLTAELESMAKTIYDYWFIQFAFPDKDGKPYRSSGGAMEWNEQLKREIPCGWKAENIQTVCSIIDCLHSQKPEKDFVAEEYYLLQLENLVDLGLIDLKSKYYVSKEMYDLWTSRIEVKDGDLVVTNAGRVGAVSRIPNYVTAGMGRNMTAIRPEKIPAFFLYYFFRSPDFSVQMRANTDAGAFFGSLNVRGIKQLMITIPPEDSDILVQFDSVVGPMRRKIEALQLEVEELTKLRDWLLPMLMNGQATVTE